MARNQTGKTDKGHPATLATTAMPYQAAVREAEEMLRAATEPDYAPHLEILKERGSLLLYQDPDGFVERARTHPIAHDAMRLVLAEMVASRVMPPESACDWLADYLRGEAERPADEAGRKREIALHDAIWLTVRDLAAQGMAATRNDVSPPISACDAVAEAMQKLELEPQTFYGIKRIWLKFQKLHVEQKST